MAPLNPAAVIIALDMPGQAEALAVVDLLGDTASHYKVGLQLLTEAGPEVVRALVARGKQVFLDLKLHEIPNSVAGAITAAGKLGVTMVTVHASAGSAVLQAAVQAAAPFPQLQVLALTVITSLGDADLPELGLAASVREHVERLAALAVRSGCHGVVASAAEAAWLSSQLPADRLIVVPGIQLLGPAGPGAAGQVTDQVRIATPAEARRNGATHIIVGRSILKAAAPQSAFGAAAAAMASRRGPP